MLNQKGEVDMKVMNLSQKQFNNLVRLSLPKEVTNTESEIYIFTCFKKWTKIKLRFSKRQNDEGKKNKSLRQEGHDGKSKGKHGIV